MAIMEVYESIGPHCLWCGIGLPSTHGPYCGGDCREGERVHLALIERDNAKFHLDTQCPRLPKVGTPHRGTIWNLAKQTMRNYYPCRCGLFHLTSKPKGTDPEKVCYYIHK
jgi:hypothetical protein